MWCSGTPIAPDRSTATTSASGAGAAGARLVNCGSWVYATIFLDSAGPSNPYWPGGAVLVEDGSPRTPPRAERLLDDRTREQLAPPAVQP